MFKPKLWMQEREYREDIRFKSQTELLSEIAVNIHSIAQDLAESNGYIPEKKKGEWLEMDDCMTICSECHGLGCNSPYCPNCGAEMKLLEEEA